MKVILSIALLGLVAGFIIVPAFADSKLDSFVNLATQARTQVKSHLDKMSYVTDDVKSLYSLGDSETDQLTESVKKGDALSAKKHFLAAMDAFRQITQFFSEQATDSSTEKITSSQSVQPNPQSSEFDYGNALKRFETNIGILKSVATKNKLPIDFSKFDKLLQITKSNLSTGNMVALNRTFTELKAEGVNLQTTIKDLVAEQSNKRAASFTSKYIAKIDSVLLQAKELGLSEDQTSKLQTAREELASNGNSTQLIIKIKQVYLINSDIIDAKNQKILSEINKQETRLGLVETKIDENIRPKFDTAKSILISVKDPESSDDKIKQLKKLDSIIKEIETYLASQQNSQNTKTSPDEQKPQSEPSPTEQKQESLKKNDPTTTDKKSNSKTKSN
ncbi:MAG TPA: hypothetical protein HA292_05875 [Candidatus Nitrosotenuis sp.]|jgi:hypothetical protein|nr:hypothetical protein [Candidatus Nitrosotenuis sp.]HIH46598.1 hypothetical protein [Candidatus Nitrosotenuis sp.]HII04254.1 hypothetical protein [Candidatus Nitrosotenuis sp.]